MFIWMNNSLTK